MRKPSDNVVPLFRVEPFLLELRSERMVDAINALRDSGFEITSMAGFNNRYRVEDSKESQK
jgi:hypothetical protein